MMKLFRYIYYCITVPKKSPLNEVQALETPNKDFLLKKH